MGDVKKDNGGDEDEYWRNRYKTITEDNQRLMERMEELQIARERPVAVAGQVVNGNQRRSRDPLAIFTAMVWDQIFSHMLEDPETVQNCLEAFPTLGEEVTVRRTQLLFHEVMPVLAAYLDVETALKLRLVCKHWNRGVEMYLEEHPRWQAYNDRVLIPHPLEWAGTLADVTLLVELTTSARVYEFSRQLSAWSSHSTEKAPHRKNPFLGRAVRLACGQTNYPVWQESVLDLAHHFGSQIYFLDLTIDINPIKISEFLPRLLQRVPNLRLLALNGLSKYRKRSVDSVRQTIYYNFFICPLVHLPHLTSLSLNIDNLLPELSKHLTHVYGEQLTVLTLRVKDLNIEDYHYFGKMAKLQQLVLVNFIPGRAKDIFYCFSDHATNLKRLTLILPPKKISCDDLAYSDPSMEWLLGWIRWTTLDTLEIKSKLPLTDFLVSWEYQGECQLPSVTTFRLTTCPGFDYDVLLSMPNLESLHLTIDLSSISDFFQLLQLLKHEDRRLDLGMYLYEEFHKNLDLYQSNVWEECPKLKMLTVYCRHGDDEELFRWIKTRDEYKNLFQKYHAPGGAGV